MSFFTVNGLVPGTVNESRVQPVGEVLSTME